MKTFLISASAALLLSLPLAAQEHVHEHTVSMNEAKTISATGILKSIADDHMSVRIFHDPIPELKWPSMNMPFQVVEHDALHGLNVGDRVRFEFVQKEGKNVIVKIGR